MKFDFKRPNRWGSSVQVLDPQQKSRGLVLNECSIYAGLKFDSMIKELNARKKLSLVVEIVRVLNPIENIWAILKARIRQHNPASSDLDELEVAAREEWVAIPQEHIVGAIRSMNRRCLAVICVICPLNTEAL